MLYACTLLSLPCMILVCTSILTSPFTVYLASIIITDYSFSATLYGRGAYFARDASYSARDTYSPPDPTSGNKYMYLARVLTGEFTTGGPNMLTPPPKDPNNPHISYDSVVDNMQDPQVFVIFQDALVYPDYLIVFKR